MKTLKNFNHWISELRSLAVEAKVFNEGDDTPMPKSEIDILFSKQNFNQQFNAGMTPKEAFEEEMEAWADASE